MSILFRSTLRASTSSSSRLSMQSMLPVSPFLRYNSSLPSSSSSSSSSIPGFDNLKFSDHIPSPKRSSSTEERESWWVERSNQNGKTGFPTTTWTGRSVLVPNGATGQFQVAYRRLQGLLRNSNIKQELRIAEFHEKPSVRRRRLISERHRRRFKEMVRNKVQQVMSMRNRG